MVRLTRLLREDFIDPAFMGPMKIQMTCANNMMKLLPKEKHFFMMGFRSIALAAHMIKNYQVIAVPTDTTYALACLAQNNYVLEKIKKLKGEGKRNKRPMEICLHQAKDISLYAHTKHLSGDLLDDLFPGQASVILRRKKSLNSLFGDGNEKVCFRVPNLDFVRSVVKVVGEPIALASAHVGKGRNNLHPNEFQELWPELGAIFWDRMNDHGFPLYWRAGSTLIDLTEPGRFTCYRIGISHRKIFGICAKHGLKENFAKKKHFVHWQNNMKNYELTLKGKY